MKGNFRTGVLRLTPMETICRGQMFLNLHPPPQAGTGGPAARSYGVGGRSSFVIQGRGFIRKPLLSGSWTATA